MRLRHSPVAALRISLAAGACALGGILFSAAATQADDGERGLELARHTVSAVKEAVQPVSDLVGGTIAAPDAGSVDPARELAERLPLPQNVADLPGSIGSTPVKDATAPTADVADNLLDQLPVAGQALPGDPASAVIEPVAEAVDSAVGTAAGTAGQVVKPVVDAAVGTVRPTPSEAPGAKSRAETIPPVGDPSPAKIAGVPTEGAESGAGPSAGPVPHREAPAAQTKTGQSTAAAPVQDQATALIPQSIPQANDDRHAGRGTPGHAPAGPFAPSPGGGANSGTGGGSPGPSGTALPPEEPKFRLSGYRSGPLGSITVPAAPAFDPGSTPD